MKLTRPSIQEMFNKFKPFLEDDTLFYGVCVVLVGLCAFGLGRLSAGEIRPISGVSQGSVVLTQSPEVSVEQGTIEGEVLDTEGMYVGSKNGSKYHLTTCPGAGQIKEENKVYFDTPTEARAQGYTPAGNCPGIE